jgi:integrase
VIVSIVELIARARIEVDRVGHAPSTDSQYLWAWSQFELFCSREGIASFTEDVAASFLEAVAADHREGRIKEWKRRLLRKAVLVLSEVAATGSYRWGVSRRTHPNDGLDATFRPVQEEFEAWLQTRGLAPATEQLYSVVSRRALACFAERGVADARALSGADVSAAVTLLARWYRPASMRTVVSVVRVLCRFLEDSGYCAGLSGSVPGMVARRVRSVAVIPRVSVDALTGSPDMSTPAGRRDRAILLLAARTGLRPVDIVHLRLRDIDWRAARITITQHKTGVGLTLPLLADVGDAIADYLIRDRPAGTAEERVFLRSQAPFTGFSPRSGLYHIAERAFAVTATPVPNGSGRGLRVLRSSLATRMLEAGTPLPVISGVLGHRGTESAKYYLAGDEQRMRECCLDFAGIEPTGGRP